jgi:hypothetical protein
MSEEVLSPLVNIDLQAVEYMSMWSPMALTSKKAGRDDGSQEKNIRLIRVGLLGVKRGSVCRGDDKCQGQK